MNFLLFAVLYIAWMVFYNLTAEHMAVDVSIDFRSSNAFMPQHALDGPQVGTSFQQVSSK